MGGVPRAYKPFAFARSLPSGRRRDYGYREVGRLAALRLAKAEDCGRRPREPANKLTGYTRGSRRAERKFHHGTFVILV